jgi:NADH-quinone oxidoreductase subunit B
MEVIRQGGAPSPTTASQRDFRSRQLTSRQLLTGDLEGQELEEYVQSAVITTTLDKAASWARGNAFMPATFGLACCAIEMMSIVAGRADIARFGFEAFRASPRQADLLILSGRVSIKMAPIVRRIYDQMLDPKYAIAMGACSSSMGVFNNYAIVPADKFMPVDVHIPGCPPRPESVMHGILKLRSMVQNDPSLGWRERYARERDGRGAARGGRALVAENVPGPSEPAETMPDATGLELLAGRAARRGARQPSSARCTSAAGDDARRSAPHPRRARAPARGRVRAPHERARRGLLPRGAPPRRPLRAARPRQARPRPREGPPAHRRAARSSRSPRTGRPPTTRSARSTTCSGVVFEGHPDPRRILMPEDYEGFPQRRDFPIGGEPILFTKDGASARLHPVDPRTP